MGLRERMGDGKRGKRLNWIRRVLIETGEKGQTPGVGARISKLSLNTHTHKLSWPRRRRPLSVTLDYSDIP